ncbi:MAG: hypothetical protein ACR2MX_04450 [Cyclobacteriaceae bacterium]
MRPTPFIQRLRQLWFAAFALSLFAHSTFGQQKLEKDFDLQIQLDNRYYLHPGLYQGQERNYFSISLNPEYLLEWDDGKKSVKASLFGRWDQYDDHRTHFDIRELYYQNNKRNLEWSIGWKKIFWGVTESIHLVDIINQTDQVESFDGEQKLGQPMLHISYPTNKGTFDFFYMPYARRRQFPDRGGRLRFSNVIEREDIKIENNWGEWTPSVAFRWSHYFGPMDIGVSQFYGVGREPLFLGLDGSREFRAIYPTISQTGVDAQATLGPWLLKLESIYRYADEQDFLALATGFEYTFGNIASSGLDIGIVGEYLYDSRDELAFSNLANDLFVGARFAFNDTQSTDFLAGAIFDLDNSSKFFSVEGSRRIGDSWKVEVEARIFQDVSKEEFFYNFREDSFLQLRFSKFF